VITMPFVFAKMGIEWKQEVYPTAAGVIEAI